MLIAPAPLRPGDTLAVIAPSSGFDRARLERGVAWLQSRYAVQMREDIFDQEGFLAGSDARRFAELTAAMHDPHVRAIVAVRGGYGLTRYVHRLDWARFAREPKWFVGFSDITALHVEATAVGVQSIHASMVASLGDADDDARARWTDTLDSGRVRGGRWSRLRVGKPFAPTPARVDGPAFGGNLAMLAASAASGRLRVPDGAIVFLEDCNERPYRIDRMLNSLIVGGYFTNVAAFVLGSFTQCAPGADGVGPEEVLMERLGTLGRPIVLDAPFGHDAVNEPFVLGAGTILELDDDVGTLSQR